MFRADRTSRSSTIIEAACETGPVRRLRTHPGEVLREELMRPHGLSANGLALALRVPAARIGAIVRKGEPRAVTNARVERGPREALEQGKL